MEAILMYMLIIILVLLSISVIGLIYAILTMNLGQPKSEINTIDAIEEYYKDKSALDRDTLTRSKLWDDFNTPETSENSDLPKRQEDGKYNHKEITGALDGMFGVNK